MQNGYPVGQKGAPLSWFTNGYESINPGLTNVTKSEEVNNKPSEDEEEGDNNSLRRSSTGAGQPIITTTSGTVGSSQDRPKKIYPKSVIERKLDYERDFQWQNYGPAWYSLMKNIQKEKDKRRHDMFLMDCKIKRIEEREQELRVRETKVPPEPFLQLAATLNEMKLTSQDALPWIRIVKKKAETEKVDHQTAAKQIAEELQFYQQLGGVEKQIELKNQELTLINISVIQKQKAITVVEDLLDKGIRVEVLLKKILR
jgi:hypothetical protein